MGAMRKAMAACAGLALSAMVAGAPAPAQAQTGWSGVYIGGNVGWVGTNFDWTFDPSLAPFQDRYSLSENNGIAGVHAGVQFQWNKIVIGAEMGLSSTAAFGRDFVRQPIPPAGVNPLTDVAARMGPIFTIGPRLGWAVNNRWLVFVSGGYANLTIASQLVNQVNGVPFFPSSRRHDGWYIGGGVEYALTDLLVLGVEYQHLEFNRLHHCDLPCELNLGGYRRINADTDIVRARLSLKFGRRDTPIEPLK